MGQGDLTEPGGNADGVQLVGPSGDGGLAKAFGDHEVLRSIDFEVQPGNVTVLIGPSGSGKRQAETLRDQSGTVFQSHHLFPHLSVLENSSWHRTLDPLD